LPRIYVARRGRRYTTRRRRSIIRDAVGPGAGATVETERDDTMPIQFTCSQCSQPIEVDDEHAGKTAACPFCQHLVTVPQESTFRPEAATTARPATGAAAPRAWEPGVAPPVPYAGPPPIPPPRLRMARTLGAYALICALLAIGLFGVGIVRALYLFEKSGLMSPTTQLTPELLAKWQRQIGTDTWVAGPQFGGLFFALVGLTMAIVGLTQSARGNWRAITAAVLCGLLFLCLCLGVVSVLMGFGGAAAG
jgi:hypothetical protein